MYNRISGMGCSYQGICSLMGLSGSYRSKLMLVGLLVLGGIGYFVSEAQVLAMQKCRSWFPAEGLSTHLC
jgi:hypothetical protein